MSKPNARNFLIDLKALSTRLGNMNIFLFFLLVLFYQILLIFQGLDIVDEGFHATSYQQIFNDPESVQYSFIFWLTDFVGGSILKLFPFAGLFGLRLAGAILCTLTLVFAYRILRKNIAPGPLKLSLILLALFINNDPKDLYYNNLSAFLYVLTAYLLYSGLLRQKKFLIFVSGVVIGMNVFTRLPNVLAPGIGLVIFYYGHLAGFSMRTRFRQFFVYAAGCVAGILIILALMKSLGQLELFIHAIRQLFSISSGAKANDGLNGSYGLMNNLVKSLKQYLRSIGIILSVFSGVVIFSYVLEYTRSWHALLRSPIRIAILVFVIFFAITMIRSGIQDLALIDAFTGLGLAAAFFIIINGKEKDSRLIVLMGIFFMLVHPLGSAVGIYTVIPYSLWLTFPFAIDYIAGIRHFSLDLNISGQKNFLRIPINISEENTLLLKAIGLTIIILTCLYQIAVYPYFCDSHSRIGMRYQVDNRFMKGVYTSRGRTESINELLGQSSKYVHANDYVLAYDLMPMYHFWTQTRPYVRNPCPWFYSSQVFSNELDQAIKKDPKLPVVVRQNVLTIGEGSKWPEEKMKENYSGLERNRGRNEVMDKFLADHHYKTVWKNNVFEIMLPGEGANLLTRENLKDN